METFSLENVNIFFFFTCTSSFQAKSCIQILKEGVENGYVNHRYSVVSYNAKCIRHGIAI